MKPFIHEIICLKGKERVTVFMYEGWFCVKDSVLVHLTSDRIYHKKNIVNVRDIDVFRWSKPIRSKEDLFEAVKYGEH